MCKALRILTFIFCFAITSLGQVNQMGDTAQDVINQTNRQAAIQMGAPFYNGEFLNVQKEKSKEYNDIIKEIEADERNNSYKVYYSKNSESKSQIDLTDYKNAYNKINDMLSGKAKLSLKDAYYYSEVAYGNAYMTKTDYDNAINESADFIKKWLAQNKYEATPTNLQGAIQDFMSLVQIKIQI